MYCSNVQEAIRRWCTVPLKGERGQEQQRGCSIQTVIDWYQRAQILSRKHSPHHYHYSCCWIMLPSEMHPGSSDQDKFPLQPLVFVVNWQQWDLDVVFCFFCSMWRNPFKFHTNVYLGLGLLSMISLFLGNFFKFWLVVTWTERSKGHGNLIWVWSAETSLGVRGIQL